MVPLEAGRFDRLHSRMGTPPAGIGSISSMTRQHSLQKLDTQPAMRILRSCESRDAARVPVVG